MSSNSACPQQHNESQSSVPGWFISPNINDKEQQGLPHNGKWHLTYYSQISAHLLLGADIKQNSFSSCVTAIVLMCSGQRNALLHLLQLSVTHILNYNVKTKGMEKKITTETSMGLFLVRVCFCILFWVVYCCVCSGYSASGNLRWWPNIHSD